MSMSTRSGTGGASGRQALPDRTPERSGGGGAEPPSPESPLRSSGPLTRKRAASLRTDGPRIEGLSLDTPTSTDTSPQQPPSDSGRDLICLCTPAPKVPRPRNAFILYRQHHQAQVVAQNPGLANPEISKIIGERWREEPDERKEQWKRLAEEEKVRHQRQYPDYRYQPRRGGKQAAAAAAAVAAAAATAASRGGSGGGSQTPTSATAPGGDDPGRCPRCGGRYIATPRTPSTPFPFSAGTPSRGTTPGGGNGSGGGGGGGGANMSFSNPNPRAAEADHLRRVSQSGGGREQHQHQHHQQQHQHDARTASLRGHYAGYSPQSQHHHHHHYQPRGGLHGISEDYDMESPSGAKRRRYDSSSGYAEGPPPYSSGGAYPYGQPYAHALPHHARQPPPPPPLPQQQQQQQQQHLTYHRHPSLGGHPPVVAGMPSPAYAPPPAPPLSGARGSISMAPPPPQQQQSAPPPRPASVAYAHAPPPPPPPPPSARLRDPAATAGGAAAAAAGFDESLRLPPLQTPAAVSQQQQQQQQLPPPAGAHAPAHPGQLGGSPSSEGTARTAPHQYPYHHPQDRDRDSQARGVEAMIMSIPYVNKLKVLEKIAPPVGGGETAAATTAVVARGPVIAVEGAVPALVRQVGGIVERALVASGECAVRVWSSGNSSSSSGGEEEGGSAAERERKAGEDAESGFATYLRTILEWHGRSGEVVRHITAPPAPARRESDVVMGEAEAEAASSAGEEKKSKPGSVNGDGAAQAATPTTTAVSQPQQQQGGHGQKQQQQKQKQRPALLPVALLTDGFSLTISDRFACRVPIADSYTPVDHWQWMATLWRGIVGPDLVVYVRGAEEEEMARLQAVELKGPEIMVVRVVVPPGAGVGMDDVQVGEKVERRLGFEVVEWVRNGTFKGREGF